MERVDKPKVFISYAWSSEEYRQKVLSFADQLINDGVDVLLDRYLAPGIDLTAFMESSVNDESVTNVLILMDKVYTEKANKRQGGVGTETQIISPELYGKVEQTKFIPVLFEREKADGIHHGYAPNYAYIKILTKYSEKSLRKMIFYVKIDKIEDGCCFGHIVTE